MNYIRRQLRKVIKKKNQVYDIRSGDLKDKSIKIRRIEKRLEK